jgi:hypothetical protein
MLDPIVPRGDILSEAAISESYPTSPKPDSQIIHAKIAHPLSVLGRLTKRTCPWMPKSTDATAWQVSGSSQSVQRICRHDQAFLQVKIRLRVSDIRMLMVRLGAGSLRSGIQPPWGGAWTRWARAPWPPLHGSNTACPPRCRFRIGRDADGSVMVSAHADGLTQPWGHLRHSGPRTRGTLPNTMVNPPKKTSVSSGVRLSLGGECVWISPQRHRL